MLPRTQLALFCCEGANRGMPSFLDVFTTVCNIPRFITLYSMVCEFKSYISIHILNQDSTFSLGNPLERPIPKSSGTLSCRPGPHEETSGQWWPGLRTLKTLRDVDIWNIYVHICKWYDKNVKRNKVNPSTFGGVVSKGCHVTKGAIHL